MHFRIFDSVVTVAVITGVAIMGLCLFAYFTHQPDKTPIYKRFVVSKQYGIVLDPEYYCPTEQGVERPWVELESGKRVQFDDAACVVSRALLQHEKDAEQELNKH